ncbi:MAG: zinc-binding alcohol dehydrogenase [Vicinamibacterales bacterium]
MPSDATRAFWVVEPGRGAILDEPLPPPSADDALVRTVYSGISRGTESLVFSGRVPESEWQRMRAPFQAGQFPAPVKYGYCNVGCVESGPRHLAGRHVFSLFPHQARFVIPAAALHVVPDEVPPARAVLAANMETALNSVWDADILPGDRVAVVGAGTVGALIAWLAGRIPGTEVCLVDVNPARASVASALGVRFALPDDAPGECDVVLHASGSGAGLERALQLAAFEAAVVEVSWFGAQRVSLPLGEAFHAKRLSIRASQVGHVAASRRPRWDYRRRMALALSLLREPALDVLITGEDAFDDLPTVMRALATGGHDAICHRIRY